MIDRVGVQTFEIDESIPDRTTIHVGVAVLDELLLEMPGLSGVGIVFGAAKRNDDGTSEESAPSWFGFRTRGSFFVWHRGSRRRSANAAEPASLGDS